MPCTPHSVPGKSATVPHAYSSRPSRSYLSILWVLRSNVTTARSAPICTKWRLDGLTAIFHSERYLPFSSKIWMRWLSRSLTNTRRVSKIDGDAVHVVHVARPRFLARLASHAEIQQELPLRVELRDAGAVVAVGHVEAAVGQPRHEGRSIEMRAVGARHVRRADRLHQLLAVVRELVDRVRVVVDDPHVLLCVVRADVDGVRALEQLVPLRPLLDDVALRVDDDDAMLPTGSRRRARDTAATRPSTAPCPSRGPDRSLRPLAASRCSRCATAGRREETARSVRSRERVASAAARIFGSSPPPSRYTRFGLSAKMPRAPPYVHFSWPGSVLRSLGQSATTSYGPETSWAPMAFGTAANVARDCASAGSSNDGSSRPPNGMPRARPTASASTMVAVLLMPDASSPSGTRGGYFGFAARTWLRPRALASYSAPSAAATSRSRLPAGSPVPARKVATPKLAVTDTGPLAVG